MSLAGSPLAGPQLQAAGSWLQAPGYRLQAPVCSARSSSGAPFTHHCAPRAHQNNRLFWARPAGPVAGRPELGARRPIGGARAPDRPPGAHLGAADGLTTGPKCHKVMRRNDYYILSASHFCPGARHGPLISWAGGEMSAREMNFAHRRPKWGAPASHARTRPANWAGGRCGRAAIMRVGVRAGARVGSLLLNPASSARRLALAATHRMAARCWPAARRQPARARRQAPGSIAQLGRARAQICSASFGSCAPVRWPPTSGTTCRPSAHCIPARWLSLARARSLDSH